MWLARLRALNRQAGTDLVPQIFVFAPDQSRILLTACDAHIVARVHVHQEFRLQSTTPVRERVSVRKPRECGSDRRSRLWRGDGAAKKRVLLKEHDDHFPNVAL